jgi:SAM-dependent methyltransferase
MTDAIDAFYSSHPYPPPVTSLDRARDEWRDPNRHRTEYHLFWPGTPYRADLDILIAGCGTSQAAKYAVCHPEARLVGIDVSQTSIDHTGTLKRQYDLSNLDLRQLPIERAAELEREFDLIVCTGVLHHLTDPDAGLRALRSVLKRDGALYLMVYAPFGRTGIYMLQDYCRRLGIGTTDREIRDLIATLEVMPQHHPLVTVLRASRDALDPDALADALLNPRERPYSVPQLFDYVERNGMTFGRWYRQAPYMPQCGAIASTPHATQLAALADRDQYAALELWRGTMTTHSAIVHRADVAGRPKGLRYELNGSSVTISFDDEGWLRYVPLRLPWTLLIQERLPPGAAGVLLNRSHQHHDLILVIDAAEERLFAGIDGRRSIADIAKHASEDRSRARALFEKLWWYDQVVFDAAGAGEGHGVVM